MIKKLINFLTSAVIIVSGVSVSKVCAEEITTTQIWYETEYGMIRKGGINQIDKTKSKSKDENIALEEQLRKENYILVTTEDKDISDEDFQTFCKGEYKPPYYSFYDDESEFVWKYYKVYVYKPIYEEVMKQLKSQKSVDLNLKSALSTSTVVIDYACWYMKERAGTVVNEFNDNIPSWRSSTGFLKIYSPIDIKVTFEYRAEHTLNEIYVKANEPLLVKLISGGYEVRIINTTAIEEIEETLVYNNNIQVYEIHTSENPYILDLNDVITKYNIQPLEKEEIENQPVYSYEEQEISEEETEVMEQKEKENSKTFWKILIVSAILVITIGIIIVIKVLKNKNSFIN